MLKINILKFTSIYLNYCFLDTTIERPEKNP